MQERKLAYSYTAIECILFIDTQVQEIIISMYLVAATKQKRETESVFFFDKAHARHFFRSA